MTFQPHGELRISVEYPLLISHARGPWNRELVVLWRKQALAHAQAMQRLGPWVGVGVMRGSMTCTLDACDGFTFATTLSRRSSLSTVTAAALW